MKNEMFEFQRNAFQGSITHPLCDEYKDEWRKCGNDKRKLVDFVLVQQSIPYFLSHCHSNKGLSKEYIFSEFSEYINGKYVAIDADGVNGGYKSELYVGYNGYLSASDDVLCMMWCKIPQMQIEATKAIKMYVGCYSEIRLNCDGYNNVTIMLFDDSKVCIDDVDEDSNILIYKYSDKCSVEIGKYCLGKVKEFNKDLIL